MLLKNEHYTRKDNSVIIHQQGNQVIIGKEAECCIPFSLKSLMEDKSGGRKGSLRITPLLRTESMTILCCKKESQVVESHWSHFSADLRFVFFLCAF